MSRSSRSRSASRARHAQPGRASSRRSIGRRRALERFIGTGIVVVLLLAVAALAGSPATTGQDATTADGQVLSGWSSRWSNRDDDRRDREREQASRQQRRSTQPSTTAPSETTTTSPEAVSDTVAPSPEAQAVDSASAPYAPAVGNSSLPYSADSFFQSRVTGAPVDAARTREFHAFMASHPDQAAINWPKINVNPDWAMSYHEGQTSDPVWRLAGGNTSDPRLAVLRTQGFHMADSVADSFPTGSQDRPGVIYDPVFGYTVQFADAVPNKATRTITVSNAGIMWHGSNGLDGRNPDSDDARNFTSRGRIPDAMVISPEQLQQAIASGTGLGHVLHLFFVETNSADGAVSPMTGAESGKSGWGAEGERIRIRPDIDLEARGLTGAALVIARTLQENGAYIGDNSGSSTQIKASQSERYAGTNLTTDALRGKITWADFEVIPRGWQG